MEGTLGTRFVAKGAKKRTIRKFVAVEKREDIKYIVCVR
jgi:hypothetical protein